MQQNKMEVASDRHRMSVNSSNLQVIPSKKADKKNFRMTMSQQKKVSANLSDEESVDPTEISDHSHVQKLNKVKSGGD